MEKALQLTAIFTGLLLIGAGCVLYQRPGETNDANGGINENVNAVNENTNENDNQPTTNTNVSNTNSEIDTSGWLTYTNDEYGFSLRYPKEWEVKQRDIKTIGLVSPELKIELENQSNSISNSDLFIVIKQPISDAPYIQTDFSESLIKADQKGYIRNLKFLSTNRAQFNEYNDFVNVDQIVHYILLKQDLLITSSYNDGASKFNTFETILDTLQSL